MSAAMPPTTVNTTAPTRCTGMPARRAASALSEDASRARPYLLRPRKIVSAMVTTATTASIVNAAALMVVLPIWKVAAETDG
ncbi:hypothetical protein L2X98_29835 [Microbacterium elymi]|uniref:Uncharacterized protein n=1 Tax=Microbacterium elymi TaxID=2909587 RepID=A0ABY5NHQ7_9MICO|nr:hypothetical protein [Microbacterium elymi]UUT34683.1 hypothetical protein L2X98_29835 [Microbacterium elymi]